MSARRRCGVVAATATVLGLFLALSGMPAGAQPPELGKPAPGFALPDLAGKTVRLQDFQGRKAVLLNFWATWCVPCREEMPTLERLARERRESLGVLGVNVDVVGQDKVREFVRELGLTFGILLDRETKVGTLYRIRALPSSFIVGKDGVLRHREIGYRDWMTPESRYIVDDALRPR